MLQVLLDFQTVQFPLITTLYLDKDKFEKVLGVSEYLSQLNPAICVLDIN